MAGSHRLIFIYDGMTNTYAKISSARSRQIRSSLTSASESKAPIRDTSPLQAALANARAVFIGTCARGVVRWASTAPGNYPGCKGLQRLHTMCPALRLRERQPHGGISDRVADGASAHSLPRCSPHEPSWHRVQQLPHNADWTTALVRDIVRGTQERIRSG